MHLSLKWLVLMLKNKIQTAWSNQYQIDFNEVIESNFNLAIFCCLWKSILQNYWSHVRQACVVQPLNFDLVLLCMYFTLRLLYQFDDKCDVNKFALTTHDLLTLVHEGAINHGTGKDMSTNWQGIQFNLTEACASMLNDKW